MEFKSVNKIIENSFRQNWDRPALSNYQGVTLNYRDVARRMAKLHIAFEQCGLQKGDKVAICSRNQANWGVSFLVDENQLGTPVMVCLRNQSSITIIDVCLLGDKRRHSGIHLQHSTGEVMLVRDFKVVADTATNGLRLRHGYSSHQANHYD